MHDNEGGAKKNLDTNKINRKVRKKKVLLP